jgi:TolB-like protein
MEMPRHLGRIIRHCLEKDPERRFQAAKDVRNELEGLRQEVESGELPPSGTMAAAAPPSQTRRWLPLATAALLVVVAAGVFWLLQGRDEAPAVATEDQTASEASAERQMIVVLPFENLGLEEEAYFAAGITEEITSRLGSVRELGVISRKSARRYADTDKTIQQLGEELGVGYVLEGTVRWASSPDGSSRVRITPQLIRVADDSQLWS